ncbi:MAG: peptide-methionine (R)-S-oxide reductase MsrB [Rhizobacter sp.]|nr:peptide-methionine (R)-S-oxide reductase MsrB [Chlorobiales bacterium]
MKYIKFFLLALCTALIACNQPKTDQANATPQSAPAQEVKAADGATAMMDAGERPKKVVKTDDEWKKILTPEQFDVLRREGTERPNSSPLLGNHEKGIYVCAGCNTEVFSSEAKFESGTGWPSFYQPYKKENINEVVDNSGGMTRTEVECYVCGGHLGHVFDDGPKPTGLRYCLDGVALKFIAQK